MRTAKSVVVSRGPWPDGRKADAIEILFDDGSDSHFVMHFGTEQVDRLLPDTDAGKCAFAVYVRGPALVAYWRDARYRRSARLPDMRPGE
jgi:hypothetical protein